jgi:hypothetical protein
MPKVPALKREDLERYYELDAERLALQRRVTNLKTLQEELEEKFIEHVRFHGGKERTVVKCGYRLVILMKRESVQWKEHLLKLVGLQRIEQIVEEQPEREKLKIEPPIPRA